MAKLVIAFIALMALITIASAYPRMYQHVSSDSPSQRANQYTQYEKPPSARRRSSFGGSSFHGGSGTSTLELKPAQHPRIQNYSIGVGQVFGAHRGEYFDKKSPWPAQSHR